MRRENLTRIVSLVVVCIVALVTCGSISAQSVVKPLQPRTSQSSSTSWHPLVQRGTGQGAIEGYVYWDGRIQHVPPAHCSGLSVTVSAGGTSLGTFTNNFAYIQDVGTYGVCTYAVHQVPVGQDLQVQVSVTAPGAFSPEILRISDARSIKIVSGKCNNLPLAVPLPTVLSSNWWTCGNYAYNVNFILDAGSQARFAPETGVGVQLLTSVPQALKSPAAGLNGARNADDLNPQPYPPKGMLLAPGSQKTMLDTRGPIPAQVAIQRTASPAGVGPSQTMNSPGNSPVSGVLTRQAGATAIAPASAAIIRAPFASANNAAIVAGACAKDPAFRVLAVSGGTSNGSGGVTLTVEQQYTILGCSFGDAPLVKRTTPVSSPQSLAAQPSHYNVSIWITPPNSHLLIVDASIESWSDNAIVVTFHHSATFDGGSISLPGKVFPAQLLVTPADGQTVIYGHEGGLSFQLRN